MSKFKSYLFGYLLSLLLVIAAFGLIYTHITSAHELFSHPFLRVTIITLAILQAIVQLKFFLHLGKNQNARWNIFLLLSTLALILIIVVGSIWIMDHLNYSMTPQQIQGYMNDQGTF